MWWNKKEKQEIEIHDNYIVTPFGASKADIDKAIDKLKKSKPPYVINDCFKYHETGNSKIPSRPFIGGITTKDIEKVQRRLLRNYNQQAGKTMNKKEAIQAMLDGEKVTLDYLQRQKYQTYWFYDGAFKEHDVFRNKTEEDKSSWGSDTVEDGWEIYQEPNKNDLPYDLNQEEYEKRTVKFLDKADGEIYTVVVGSESYEEYAERDQYRRLPDYV